MSMSNFINNINTNDNNILPKQFLNYIDYELSCFKKIPKKKFFFVSRNGKFQLNVYGSKKYEEIENNNNSKYQII